MRARSEKSENDVKMGLFRRGGPKHPLSRLSRTLGLVFSVCVDKSTGPNSEHVDDIPLFNKLFDFQPNDKEFFLLKFGFEWEKVFFCLHAK